MWPAIIAAGGSILGSALSGIFGIGSTNSANSANLQATRETNEANKQLAQQQNNFNYQMWQENNQYNSPLAQMRRFREAGLSGAAAAQAVSGVPSQPVLSANLSNQVTPPPMQAPDYSFIGQNFIGIARELAALKKENAEANIAETNANFQPQLLFTKLQAEQAAWQATVQQTMHEAKMFPYRFAQGYYETKTKKAYADNVHLYIKQQELNVKQMQQQVDSFWRNNDIQYQKSVQELRNLFQQGKNLEKEGKNIDADTNLKNAQTAVAGANVEKINAETQNIKDANEGVKANSRIQQVQAILAENGYPDNFQQRVAGLMASGQMSDDQCLKFIESIGNTQNLHREAAEGNAELWQYYLEVFDEGWKSTIDKATGVVGKGLDVIGKVAGAPNVTKFITNHNNIHN